MRTRAILPAVTLVLASGLSTTGCQVIAGIDGLEVAVGTACKMASECGTSTDCRTFSCDDGTCKTTDTKSGAPCGGKCAADMVTPPGTCNAGKCSAEEKSCSPYACNQAGTACNDRCDMSGGCSTDGVCLGQMMKCEACGFTPPPPPPPPPPAPPPPPCPGECESCNGDTCVKTCDSMDGGVNECSGNVGLNTIMQPARLLCKDQCNNTTVNCGGAALCEVVCDDSKGCQNLIVICSPDGPCKLTCDGPGCTGTVNMRCGGNTCSVACNGPDRVFVNQMCGASCACSKDPGCR
jgi:hypothetical protein